MRPLISTLLLTERIAWISLFAAFAKALRVTALRAALVPLLLCASLGYSAVLGAADPGCEATAGHACGVPAELLSEPSLLSGECETEVDPVEQLSSLQRRSTRVEAPRSIVVQPLPQPQPAASPALVSAPLHLRPQHAHRNGTRAPQRC